LFFESPNLEALEFFAHRIAHERGPITTFEFGGAIGGGQKLRLHHDLDCFHVWNLFHGLLHSEPLRREGCGVGVEVDRFTRGFGAVDVENGEDSFGGWAEFEALFFGVQTECRADPGHADAGALFVADRHAFGQQCVCEGGLLQLFGSRGDGSFGGEFGFAALAVFALGFFVVAAFKLIQGIFQIVQETHLSMLKR